MYTHKLIGICKGGIVHIYDIYIYLSRASQCSPLFTSVCGILYHSPLALCTLSYVPSRNLTQPINSKTANIHDMNNKEMRFWFASQHQQKIIFVKNIVRHLSAVSICRSLSKRANKITQINNCNRHPH